jgi:hypothetical protein
MNDLNRLAIAQVIMREFATETGLTSARPPQRYLWTDAHAVCNFVALASKLDEPESMDHATALVSQVHTVLGKHRDDDVRVGWISGLDDTQGEQHPTAGGLRIGKALPERAPEQTYDAQAEWDQDGQYFHYLTKWMHALYQIGKATDDARYIEWAKELATTAVQKFMSTSGPPRLVWKMSIDLNRALVPSSGLHDPLDGYVTALVLLGASSDEPFTNVSGQLAALCRDQDWVTDDPLGIGGLLFDACRLAQLSARPGTANTQQWLADVSGAALTSLRNYLSQSPLQLPAGRRLAFRELGFAIGLQGIEFLQHSLGLHAETAQYLQSVANDIETFWLIPEHQEQPTWLEHYDINRVMLATSLLSPTFLEI